MTDDKHMLSSNNFYNVNLKYPPIYNFHVSDLSIYSDIAYLGGKSPVSTAIAKQS